MPDSNITENADCGGCALDAVAPDRRAFFRHAAAAVAATLVALGARQAEALEAPLVFTRAIVERGQAKTYAIPAADGVEIDRDNEVIVARWQGAVYAFALACPHQNTALRWNASEGRFQCPKHKSQYRPDGTFIQGRATRGMDRFSIKKQGTSIVVDLDALHEEDEDAAGWAAAVVRV